MARGQQPADTRQLGNTQHEKTSINRGSSRAFSSYPAGESGKSKLHKTVTAASSPLLRVHFSETGYDVLLQWEGGTFFSHIGDQLTLVNVDDRLTGPSGR